MSAFQTLFAEEGVAERRGVWDDLGRPTILW
jgi:hypothetical protein